MRCARRNGLNGTLFVTLLSLILTASIASAATTAAASEQDFLRQGATALQAGQTDLAIEKYKAALQAAPSGTANRSAVEFLLGIAYGKAGRWKESVDALNAAIRDNSSLGYLPYSLLGFSYQRLGRWQDSLAAFQRAAKLRPDDAGVQAGLGAALVVLGKPEEAVQPLEKAVHLNPTFAANYFSLGLAYSKSDRLDAAIKEFDEAIRLDPHNAFAYLYLGEALGKSRRYQEEIAAEQQANRLNPKSAEAYYLMGTAYGASNRLSEAASAYAKATELKPDYFDAYAGLASADVQLQRWQDSRKALQASEHLNGSTNFAAYSNLAISYQRFGLWQRAVASAAEAVKLKPDCSDCYWLLGYGYQNLGRDDEARKAYEQALVVRPSYAAALVGLSQLAETSGDLEAAQKYLNGASHSLGNFTTNGQLQIQMEGEIFTERGDIERDLGNYAEAFGLYMKGIENYRSIADHKEADTTLTKIAEVYRQIGDNRDSASWYEYALQEAKEAGNIDGEITALLRLSVLAWSTGDQAASYKYIRESQALTQGLSKDTTSSMLVLGESGGMVGELLAEYGEPVQAISFLQARIASLRNIAQGEATLREIALSSVFLADAQIRAEQYSQALESLERARAIAEKYKSPEVMFVYGRIGNVFEKQGDLKDAHLYYRRAGEVFERFGAAQQLPQLQLSSRELAWGIYEDLTRVTLELYSKTPTVELLNQAFAYHEEGRARALLNLLNNAGVRARKGVAPNLVEQEDRLRADISALQNAFSDERVSEFRNTSLQEAMDEQAAALGRLHAKMAALNSKYESIASPQMSNLADVQALLGSDSVLLEYDLGPEFSGVAVVTNHEIRVYRLPSQDVITKSLNEFLPTLWVPLFGQDEIEKHVRLAKNLYQELLGSAGDLLRSKHHIVIVPDADLYYLPFETLIAPDKKPERPGGSLASQPYLGKAYSFSYAPSSSVLVAVERNALKNRVSRLANQSPLLAFGDPSLGPSPPASQLALSTRGAYKEMGVTFIPLPYSREEIRRVAAVFGIKPGSSSINLGDQATKKRLEQLDLTQYRFLHFATHAVVGDEVKWINQPALILSPERNGESDDGLLKMSDIFNLRLNADLVVLSACETARGKMSRGEGIVGLTSAFLFAGSDSVVASLWNVNDESTSRFMQFFYQGLHSGLSKAEALRVARNELMNTRITSPETQEEEDLSSPYFWAPFILVGGWK